MSRVARGFGSFLLHLRESNRLTSIKEQKSVTKMGHQGTSVSLWRILQQLLSRKNPRGKQRGIESCAQVNTKFVIQ